MTTRTSRAGRLWTMADCSGSPTQLLAQFIGPRSFLRDEEDFPGEVAVVLDVHGTLGMARGGWVVFVRGGWRRRAVSRANTERREMSNSREAENVR